MQSTRFWRLEPTGSTVTVQSTLPAHIVWGQVSNVGSSSTSESTSSGQAAVPASAHFVQQSWSRSAEALDVAQKSIAWLPKAWSSSDEEAEEEAAGQAGGSGKAEDRGASSSNPNQPPQKEESTFLSFEKDILKLKGLWSTGSALHASMECKPCHYVHTQEGCKNSAECDFCHLPHTRPAGPRPCKAKRAHCKRSMDALEELLKDHPQHIDGFVTRVTAQSDYLQDLMQKRLAACKGAAEATDSMGEDLPTTDSAKVLLSL